MLLDLLSQLQLKLWNWRVSLSLDFILPLELLSPQLAAFNVSEQAAADTLQAATQAAGQGVEELCKVGKEGLSPRRPAPPPPPHLRVRNVDADAVCAGPDAVQSIAERGGLKLPARRPAGRAAGIRPRARPDPRRKPARSATRHPAGATPMPAPDRH